MTSARTTYSSSSDGRVENSQSRSLNSPLLIQSNQPLKPSVTGITGYPGLLSLTYPRLPRAHDLIDLYYLHRKDPEVPIEGSVGAITKPSRIANIQEPTQLFSFSVVFPVVELKQITYDRLALPSYTLHLRLCECVPHEFQRRTLCKVKSRLEPRQAPFRDDFLAA
jgi:hypothetical protein